MFSAVSTFFYKLLVFLMTVSNLIAPGKVPGNTDPIAPAKDGAKLHVVFWGDSQVSDYLLSRQKAFSAACLDVANAAVAPDAVLIAGDIAENGKASEYRLILDDLKTVENVDRFVLATGNHDVRMRVFSQTVKSFGEFCKEADPANPIDGKLYYTYEVNGYAFIVLGCTRTEFEEAYLDDAELLWLDAELAKATKNGLPAFVVLHQPLKKTHNLPAAWGSPLPAAGSVGAQSDQIKDILNKYRNVFLLTGHLHSGLSAVNFETVGNFVSVNVPSVGIVSKDGGYEASGTGYMLEVYENEVLFRARDFASGLYLPEFDRAFPIR